MTETSSGGRQCTWLLGRDLRALSSVLSAHWNFRLACLVAACFLCWNVPCRSKREVQTGLRGIFAPGCTCRNQECCEISFHSNLSTLCMQARAHFNSCRARFWSMIFPHSRRRDLGLMQGILLSQSQRSLHADWDPYQILYGHVLRARSFLILDGSEGRLDTGHLFLFGPLQLVVN